MLTHVQQLIRAMNRERKLNLALIDQMFPPKVAAQLRSGKPLLPESYDDVTIFFSDVEGFTKMSAAVPPIQVVQFLNELYTVMDHCAALFPLYKVETIGDAYMVVSGLPEPDADHVENLANFALVVQRAVAAVRNPLDGKPTRIRMGIHHGPVVAGVVGNLMPRYIGCFVLIVRLRAALIFFIVLIDYNLPQVLSLRRNGQFGQPHGEHW